MRDPSNDYDVIIIGGGPAGATLGSMLGMSGRRALIIEKDIHPRDHVGESLSPSTNAIFHQIGFLPKMELAGFVHKPGTGWTGPRTPLDQYVWIRISEAPPPDAVQLHTYNVERDTMDAMLLRHAHELGAEVLQGVTVRHVLFEGDRAVGVRAAVSDGWERDVRAPVIVDASGRRCMLATQLGLKKKDPGFNQFSIFSWFKGVEPNPVGYEGFLLLQFLGLERAWAWQIPLRNGVWSVGVVTDKSDFQKSGRSHEDFFQSLLIRNRNVQHNMRNAERIRPWWIEADYSYKIDTLHGKGWLLIGDALRFVDPIFSSGVDVALFSAKYAFEAIEEVSSGRDEETAFREFESRVTGGVDAWYELISLFYQLQNLFTVFTVRRRFRRKVIRLLQGNLYVPEALELARDMIATFEESYQKIMTNPSNLLRVGALDPFRRDEGASSGTDGAAREPRKPQGVTRRG
jgi:flavin-dependent dehydrogenase